MSGYEEAFERAMLLALRDNRQKVSQIQALERLTIERPGAEVWELDVENASPAEGGFAVKLTGTARRIK